jgi:hypothetical protein
MGARILTRTSFGLVAFLIVAGFAAPPARAAAGPPPKPVETETILVPPGEAGPDIGAEAPNEGDDTAPPAPSAPMEIPTVEYDVSKLPTPVARLREQIIEAASTGDPERLRPIIDANDGEPLDLGPGQGDTDPIQYLKSQAGDEGGREILAIIIEVFEAGYVHVDVGTPDEMYVWPYFARYPVDALTPRQLVELFKLVYAGDYEDMLAYGLYTSYRAGIAPDGTWRFFLSD